MNDKLIDGKVISKKIRLKVKEQVSKIDSKLKLVVFLIGDNPASEIYVNIKKRRAAEVGIECIVEKIDEITDENLIEKIEEVNNDKTVTSILVQLPLKDNDQEKILKTINPLKDADGLVNTNIVSCPVKGILILLDEYKVSLKGKIISVIGQSKNLGSQLSDEIESNGGIVNRIDINTKNPKELTRKSDIVISAVGHKHLINSDWIKDGAILIDVGITKKDGKTYGDIDFDDVIDKVSLITPMPGGVGPMTVSSLLDNIVICHNLQKNQ